MVNMPARFGINGSLCHPVIFPSTNTAKQDQVLPFPLARTSPREGSKHWFHLPTMMPIPTAAITTAGPSPRCIPNALFCHHYSFCSTILCHSDSGLLISYINLEFRHPHGVFPTPKSKVLGLRYQCLPSQKPYFLKGHHHLKYNLDMSTGSSHVISCASGITNIIWGLLALKGRFWRVYLTLPLHALYNTYI